LLRGFSAPVKLEYTYSQEELLFLMSNDSDGFCRWDACQQLGKLAIEQEIKAYREGRKIVCDPRLLSAYGVLLEDESLDKAMVAHMLQLPSEAYLSEEARQIDVEGIHYARSGIRKALSVGLKPSFLQVYRDNQTNDEYSASADQVARRALKNTALAYLMLDADDAILTLCYQQFNEADNMTDVLAALTALVNCPHKQVLALKQAALETFYETWKDESLVVNQWFQVQAGCQLPGNLAVVKSLMKHPAFDFKNPNKLRALVGAFCATNAINFHQLDGEGYEFLADQIIVLNESNPQIASRLLTPLTRWRKYPQQRRELMRAQLERIKSEPSLSKDVFEVLAKTLG
jgi:aminopeptidase N